MRKLVTVVALVLTTGVAFAGTASAAPPAQTAFTCVHFQDPTVELVWSHVCHF